MHRPLVTRSLRLLGTLCVAGATFIACSAANEVGTGTDTGGSGAKTGGGPDGGPSGPNGSGGGANGGAGSGSGGTSGSTGTNGGANGGPGVGGGLVTGGPRFPGAGTGYAGGPLAPGLGPDTAGECSQPPDIGPQVTVKDQGRTCFYGGDAKAPAATVEHILESIDGKEYLHVKVTFDPYFVDNSFGKTGIGWNPRRPHTFQSDLTKSDHVQIIVNDGAGAKVMDFKVDYISADPSKPCGWGTLGVRGGDGGMLVGNPDHIIAASTSLDRNLNGCGYCSYTVDSPATDDSYTPNPATPNWDYRVVYEVWIDPAAFGSAGFGSAFVEFVHASPAKADSDTVYVKPGPCPPDWDVPYCPPHLIGEGTACGGNPPGNGGSTGAGGTPGSGGMPGSGGTPGSGGAGYGGAGGYTGQCPPGYVPDIQTEGRTCVPA